MKNAFLRSAIFIFMVVTSLRSIAQQAMFKDTLLDHLRGKWVLTGAIAGQPTTHDVAAEWVMGHQYLKIHEISREKTPNGAPVYEAEVYIGWQQAAGKYGCMWMDTYGGISPVSLATAPKNYDNEIICICR